MPAPHEIVASPLTLFLAPVGTAFPAIDDTEATFDPAWIKLGTEGDNNYDDDGVSLSHNEETSDFTPAGSTMPVKRFRTGEEHMLSLNLVDVSPEQYAMVMNDAAITTIAAASSVAGEKRFSVYRGDQVNSYAVVARGMSSVDNDLNAQFEVSKAFVSVNGDVSFKKGEPAALPVEVLCVRHSDSDVIQWRIQTAVALP